MGFLAPYMLWGAAAAGIPIALHFFFRSRYRTVPWAAMKFLLVSIEQTSRRLRFQELLLLLARVAVLVLLAVALARPLWSSAAGSARGEAVDAVFLIDNSFSMGAKEAGHTRLERAREAALSVLDQLPPHSTVQVVTCADRAALLGPAAASNLDQARDLINHVELTGLATDLLPGAREATAALRRGQSPGRELYVFSDMQKLGWDQQAGPLAQALKDAHDRDRAAVYLVRCARDTKVASNAAVTGIEPQLGVPRPGERIGFAVFVHNRGTGPLANLQVKLTVDGDEKTAEVQAVPPIGPGDKRAVTLTAKVDRPGLRVVSAVLTGDDLEADNRFDRVIDVRDFVRTLVVDGSPSDKEPIKAASFYLGHTLLPVNEVERKRWALRPEVVSAGQAAANLLDTQDLCVLADVALAADGKGKGEALSPEFVERLGAFVRQGHGLIIFGGDNVRAGDYNRVLGEGQGLLPAPIKGFHETAAQKPLFLNRQSGTLPGLQQFQDDNFKQICEFVKFWKVLDVAEPAAGAKGKADKGPAGKGEGGCVLLRYSDGRPLVVARRVGAGEVFLVATNANPGWKADSTDPTWSTLPLLSPVNIPLVHTLVNHLTQGEAHARNAVAGSPALLPVAEKDAGRSFVLLTPGGEKVRLGLPEVVGGRPVLPVADLARAGVYRVVAARRENPHSSEGEPAEPKQAKGGGQPGQPLAVVPDLRESENLDSLTDRQLDERLGFAVHHVAAGADPGSFAGVERSGREWTPWLLGAVLALAVGEALLAWFCGRAW